jgi:hypothetical protein
VRREKRREQREYSWSPRREIIETIIDDDGT